MKKNGLELAYDAYLPQTLLRPLFVNPNSSESGTPGQAYQNTKLEQHGGGNDIYRTYEPRSDIIITKNDRELHALINKSLPE